MVLDAQNALNEEWGGRMAAPRNQTPTGPSWCQWGLAVVVSAKMKSHRKRTPKMSRFSEIGSTSEQLTAM